MENQKAFMFYLSWREQFDMLTADETKNFITNLFNYHEGKELYFTSKLEEMFFTSIKISLSSNKEKYVAKVEKNRENGRKGGRPITQKNPTVISENPEKANGLKNNPEKANGLKNNPKNPNKKEEVINKKEEVINKKEEVINENELEKIEEVINENELDLSLSDDVTEYMKNIGKYNIIAGYQFASSIGLYYSEYIMITSIEEKKEFILNKILEQEEKKKIEKEKLQSKTNINFN